jgi:ABC-type molybdate transport system ATPase subunit
VKKIAVMPSGVRLSKYPMEKPAPNRFKGRIREIFIRSPIVSIDVQIAGTRITAELSEHLWHETDLAVADTVHVEVCLEGIRIQSEPD